MNPLFVGIDVSSKNNVVCLMKPDGTKFSTFSVQNNLTTAIKAPDSPVWEVHASGGEDGIKAVTFHFPDFPEKDDQKRGGVDNE